MASKLDLTFSNIAPDGDHALVCLVGAKGKLFPSLDKDVAASVIAAMATAQFTGEADKSLTLHLEAMTVVLIGVGDGVDAGSAAEAVGVVFSAVAALQSKRAFLPDQGITDGVLADLVLGMQSAAYHFETYFTETSSRVGSVQVKIVSDSVTEETPVVADRLALMAGVAMARDLAFEPANKLYPVEFADQCADLAGLGLDVTILDEEAMASLGMGALLGVGQGSRRESRLVVMNWRGGGEEAPIALVGKGSPLTAAVFR